MSIDVFPATVLNSTLWNGQTYEEGTFTLTGTGFSGTAPSGTATYRRAGSIVSIWLPQISGTSNATTFFLTGWPVALIPSMGNFSVPIHVIDNSSNYTVGILYLRPGVNIEVFSTVALGGWTASGTKVFLPIAVSFPLASTLAAPGWTGQSYEEGTFTVTGTGFSGTAPSGTARYVRVGKSITLCTPFLSGTSNATTFALTGLPSALRPPDYVYLVNYVQDNGAGRSGLMTLSPDGTWNLISSVLSGDAGAWTASGPKAVFQMSVAYNLA